MCKPGPEGLFAIQRGTGNGAEAGGVAAKCIGLTFFSPPSEEAGTTGCVEGEQEEQVEQEQQEEQVVMREEEDEK